MSGFDIDQIDTADEALGLFEQWDRRVAHIEDPAHEGHTAYIQELRSDLKRAESASDLRETIEHWHKTYQTLEILASFPSPKRNVVGEQIQEALDEGRAEAALEIAQNHARPPQDLTTDEALERLHNSEAYHYAREKSRRIITRFADEGARDRWVEWGAFAREALEQDSRPVLRTRLAAQRRDDPWHTEKDPDVRAVYQWSSEPTPRPPWKVIRTRYGTADRDDPLGYGQVLCWWLCQDPDGPQLSPNEAASHLGHAKRQPVDTLLRGARDKLEDLEE